ncbi:PE family protein [Mycobacterium sp. ML4]
MTYVSAEPQIIATAAADLEEIEVALSAAAAAPTSNLVAAAADEVSAAVAQLFGAYGAQCQVAVAHLAALQDEFRRVLAAAGFAYAETEVANTATIAATPLNGPTVSLVMGGSGNALPDGEYMTNVLNFATPQFGSTVGRALFTPEQLYPLTGEKSLVLNTSVSQGVTMLHRAILDQIAQGNSVVVNGYSQSAIISSLEMRQLAGMPGAPMADRLGFVLLADPMNPNGGLLSRFAGLAAPSLGLDFFGATPSDTIYPTSIYTHEYDGFADFPRYPLNFVSDLNAVAGIALVHTDTPLINPQTLPPGDLVQLPTSPGYSGNTSYYMIISHHLPLLAPVRAIPVVGPALADLVEPNLTTIVNLGYGDSHYGYSTSPADVPTPFGLFPAVDPVQLTGDLVLGTQQGFNTATTTFMSQPPATPLDLSGLGTFRTRAPLPAPPPELLTTSPTEFISDLQAANSYLANSFTEVTSRTYATLLPTVDIANAALTTLPSYNLNLFVDGIEQAVNGDPMGLVNAIGYPIAADVGLLGVGAGLEGLVLLGTVVTDF